MANVDGVGVINIQSHEYVCALLTWVFSTFWHFGQGVFSSSTQSPSASFFFHHESGTKKG
jgi:hypothetical protein